MLSVTSRCVNKPERHARKLLRPAEKRQCGDGRIVGAHRIAGVGTGKREGQGFLYGRAGGSYGEVLRAGGKVHGRSERRTAIGGTEGRANYRAEREEEQGNAYQTGGASSLIIFYNIV